MTKTISAPELAVKLDLGPHEFACVPYVDRRYLFIITGAELTTDGSIHPRTTRDGNSRSLDVLTGLGEKLEATLRADDMFSIDETWYGGRNFVRVQASIDDVVMILSRILRYDYAGLNPVEIDRYVIV